MSEIVTLDFWEALQSGAHWLSVLITVILVGFVVALHYEVLERVNAWLPRSNLPRRPKVLVLIVVVLIAHALEVWIFGLGIYVTEKIPGAGVIQGAESLRLLDAVYVSAATFTTVGYGDLYPQGAIRMLLGTESLTGFVLITWSASFTYLEMQRFWQR